MKVISRRRLVPKRRATPARSQPVRQQRSRPVLGLGDWVESWAKPIAVEIDRVMADFGRRTKLAGCSACSKRRRYLNLVVPDLRSLSAWRTAHRRIRPAWRQTYPRPAWKRRPTVH